MTMTAEVVSNQQAGPDIYLLRLKAAGPARSARPGQFVMLRVTPGLDPLLARPFSIHGVEDDELLLLYRVVGKGTQLLTQAGPGQGLSIWGPLGRGFDLSLDRPLLVAGGMGHAPLAFAAQYLESRDKAMGYLLGAAGQEYLLPFRESLASGLKRGINSESMADFWQSRTNQDQLDKRERPLVYLGEATDDGTIGHKGLVTDLLFHALSSYPDIFSGVLACGPLSMLKSVAKICADLNKTCQVSLEAPMACGLGACLGCVMPSRDGAYLRTCQEGPVMDACLVDWERI